MCVHMHVIRDRRLNSWPAQPRACRPTANSSISILLIHLPERIFFKVAVLTYRAVNGSAPVYLSSYFTRVEWDFDHPPLTNWQSVILQPYSAVSLDYPACTSHASTVAHGFLTASFLRLFSSGALLPWLNHLTLRVYILLWT